MKIVSCATKPKDAVKLRNYIFLIFIFVLLSCENDNRRNPFRPEPARDEAEVYEENIEEIESFLETHYYKVEDDEVQAHFKRVVFDTIGKKDTDKTPLIESEHLKQKTVQQNDVEYTVYYLVIKKGNEEEYQPTFADKVAVSYKAEALNQRLMRNVRTPIVVDFPQSNEPFITLKGVIAGITEFHGGSAISENPDGTIEYSDDFGIGAVFVPSGLGFFNAPPQEALILPYDPFILSFQLISAVQMDHDGDGIPSYMEDLNGNGNLDDDDTDGDGTPNYLDDDDDGDGTPTRDEIIIHKTDKDWLTPADIEFPDSNDSGTPDYLDKETK